MVSKRGFSSVLLLLLVVLLAGCSGILPGQPETPAPDVRRGTLTLHVDTTALVDNAPAQYTARLILTNGKKSHDDTLQSVADGFSATVAPLDVGSWELVLHVSPNDSDESLVTFETTVAIAKDETSSLQLYAYKIDGDLVLATEPGDEDSDGDDGTDPGEPSEPSEPGEPDPGDGTSPDPGDGDDGEDPQPGDGDGDEQPTPPTTTRDVRYIQSGNRVATRTEVVIIRSSEPGPTVMVVGGVHGGETSGWIVAGEVARTWDIDRGTLVVLPEANKDAVRRRLRTGTDGRDMNRAFPFGRDIDRSTDWMLAREIWNIVEEFQPVALIDLHEGWGLREANDRFPGGTLSVGQTLITYPTGDAEQFTDHVISVLDRDHNPFYGVGGYTYHFRKIGPPVQGSLAYKAGRDLGIPAFIAEPTQGRAGRHQTTVEQRSKWHRVIVDEFLRWYGVRD